MAKQKKSQRLTGEIFDALPADEKERVYREFDSMTSRQIKAASKPISAKEWAAMHRLADKPTGRAKPERNGHKVIAVSLETGLLSRVDAYARQTKTKRSELIARGLLNIISEKAAG